MSNRRRKTSPGVSLSYKHPLITTGLTNRCGWIWTAVPCPYLHLQVKICSACRHDCQHTEQHPALWESLCINKSCSLGSGRRTNNLFWLSPFSLLHALLQAAFLYSQLCIYPLSILAAKLRYSTPCDTPHSFTWEHHSLCPFTSQYFYPAALDSQFPHTMSSLMWADHF